MNIVTLKKITQMRTRGFVLPLTLIVCVIMLTISAGISAILSKELYFSRLSRLSQIAYYAADNGLMCATTIDDQYYDRETGLGIFQYNNLVTSQMVLEKVNVQRVASGLNSLSLNDIKCAASSIFDTSVSNYAVTPFSRTDSAGNTDTGQTSTFNMRMDLGAGEYRCATVLVNKTPTYRQIISRGFASCGSVYAYPIERAIVSTSESLGVSTFIPSGGGSGSVNVVLTSGASWTVPNGITSLKVWAVGAGGGGAGSIGSDGTSGGAGGAGGVAYRDYTVTPGQVISYSIGSSGTGASNANDGFDGSDTTATVSGVTIQARGGGGGKYNSGNRGIGGNSTGGTPNRKGGDGSGASGDTGGGGGGGLGEADGVSNGASGGTGGQAQDVNGLLSVVSGSGYLTTGPGTGGGSGNSNVNAMNGTQATGFGSGGGGAGYYGGNGGNGLYGGGGGGAAGYSAGGMTGGNGGAGAVVISGQ